MADDASLTVAYGGSSAWQVLEEFLSMCTFRCKVSVLIKTL